MKIRSAVILFLCVLTRPAVFMDIQTNSLTTLDRYSRVQIVSVRGDKTLVYVQDRYLQIDTDKLLCR